MGAMMGGSKYWASAMTITLLIYIPSCGCDHRLHLWYTTARNTLLNPFNLVPGTVNIMRYGAGPNGVMRSLGQYMAGSGATFGYETCYGAVERLLTSSADSSCRLEA